VQSSHRQPQALDLQDSHSRTHVDAITPHNHTQRITRRLDSSLASPTTVKNPNEPGDPVVGRTLPRYFLFAQWSEAKREGAYVPRSGRADRIGRNSEGWILWCFYHYGKNSIGPVMPIHFAYPSNNISNLFLLFGGTYNVPSISPSLLTHAPLTNFGFGTVTFTKG